MSLKYCPIEWNVILYKIPRNNSDFKEIKYKLFIEGPYTTQYDIMNIKSIGYCVSSDLSRLYLNVEDLMGIAKTFIILNYFLEELNYKLSHKLSNKVIVDAMNETFTTTMMYNFNLGCTLLLGGFEND